MKTPSFRHALAVCAVVALFASLASAEEAKNQTKPRSSSGSKASATTKVTTQDEAVTFTGSRIPRTARKTSYSRDVEMSVVVIDRKQIDRLGGGTLTESLRKSPLFR